jgi:hypothetical protein
MEQLPIGLGLSDIFRLLRMSTCILLPSGPEAVKENRLDTTGPPYIWFLVPDMVAQLCSSRAIGDSSQICSRTYSQISFTGGARKTRSA